MFKQLRINLNAKHEGISKDAAHSAVEEALDRIRNARDNLDGVIAETRRVLQ